MSKTNQTMMLVSQTHRNMPTFSLIRISEECPFVECIYVPDEKRLAVLSTVQKDTFHMFPKLDDNGDVAVAKTRKVQGKNFKEERKPIKTFYEYSLNTPEEIENFVKLFALNYSEFSIKDYLNK